MAPSGTGGSVQEEQHRPSTSSNLSSSPLSASALDAALAAQRSSARLVVSVSL